MAPAASAHSSQRPSSSQSSGRQYHHNANDSRGSAGSGATPRHERTPNTPRKESNGRERAVQDPGLRDYVGRPAAREYVLVYDRIGRRRRAEIHTFMGRGLTFCLLGSCAAPRRVFRQGCFWVRLQGHPLGHGRGCGSQADQACEPAQERASYDRGETIQVFCCDGVGANRGK